MKISELILTRRSIRKFKDEPIPLKNLIKILEAARWAPSATNRQVIRYVLITEKEILKSIEKNVKILFFKQSHAAQATAMIVVCADTNKWIEEIGAAIQNMLLMAWELGIGSCWIGAFNRKKIKEILGIPEKFKVFALILLGYPNETPNPPPRLELGKIAFLNRWKNPIIKPKGSGLLPKSGIISIITKDFQKIEIDSPLMENNNENIKQNMRNNVEEDE
ncbi:MAG: nitroreductase family protein [Candidatus Helarchaeota archaeon]